MICLKCKKEIPDDSKFCKFCGKKQVSEKRRTRRRANGQGGVIKLPGTRKKPYAARLPAVYNDSGSCKRKILGYFSTKTEALNALNAAISNGIAEVVDYTLADIYNEWKSQQFPELSKKSIDAYETAYKHIEYLHKKKMKDIRAKDVQQIIDEIGKPETGKKIRVLFSQLCKYAMSIDIVSQNYSQFIKIKSAEKAEKEIFTVSEIRKIKDAAESGESYSDDAKIVMMMLFTGTRISEITGIKYSKVYPYYEIPYMIGGIKTEAGKDRIIPIHSEILEYVRYFYSMGAPNREYLLINSKGGKLEASNFRRRHYYPLLEALGIEKKSPHSTRHTYTTMLHASGAKQENIIKLVGHTDFKTTQEHYIHQTINELKATIEMWKIE